MSFKIIHPTDFVVRFGVVKRAKFSLSSLVNFCDPKSRLRLKARFAPEAKSFRHSMTTCTKALTNFHNSFHSYFEFIRTDLFNDSDSVG